MAGPTPIVQFFSSNGDGTGTTSMDVDGSTVAQAFTVDDPGDDITIVRLLIYIEDTGAFDTNLFGNGVALTNGCTLDHVDSTDTTLETLTPTAIKQNSHWGLYAFDHNVFTYGAGPEYLVSRWTLAKFADPGIKLSNGEKLEFTVADNLTGLDAFYIVAQGFQ